MANKEIKGKRWELVRDLYPPKLDSKKKQLEEGRGYARDPIKRFAESCSACNRTGRIIGINGKYKPCPRCIDN